MDQFSTSRKSLETVQLSGLQLTGINKFANVAEPDENSSLCVSHSLRDLELIGEVMNEICAVIEANLCSDVKQICAVMESKSVRRWKANFCSDGRDFGSDGMQIYTEMKGKLL